MKENRVLRINGTMLNKNQLEKHLEKVAASHNIKNKPEKDTYPVPVLKDNFEIITEVYQMLNEHVKLGITIHPAGEWLLDNYYIIEETVKQIEQELTLKKYMNFVGIANGEYKGFARIYVLASEIVAYSDNKIEKQNLEDELKSYQSKKTLSMDEIWNIGVFLEIAIIQNITEICEKIYSSQMQKYKVESIVERLVENKPKTEWNFKVGARKNIQKEIYPDTSYAFIEYMSYSLKKYGKKAYSYLQILEETVEKLGTTISEVIQKEHFNIAIEKVSMGNSITSIKKIQRINFLEIFEKINGVEDILKQDPAGVYSRMDNKTKEYYRNKIKEISNKTKISEIYIARKILELAQNEAQKETQNEKQNKIQEGRQTEKGNKKSSHIGYYLIDKGTNQLYKALGYQTTRQMTEQEKTKTYILGIILLSAIISIMLSYWLTKGTNIGIGILSFILFFIPSSEIAIQLVQTILSKCVQPKLIPKIDFINGVDKENSTMVVIPTIVKNKEKVRELARKLEVYYLANKSENLYFTLLGDCSQSEKQIEEFDKEVIEEGKIQIQKLNQKYCTEKTPIFFFMYRKREWNESENCYLGWERKRGMLNQFNEYLLGNIKNPFLANTMEELKTKVDKTENIENIENMQKENKNINDKNLLKIKYIITLDADTDLVLNSAFELIGAMAHILNEPVIDTQKNVVIDGYGIIQPRVGINLDISYKTLFTQIFAGAGGIDGYTNAISDIYQDNFKEGIFTGKGIYNLQTFSKVLNGEIPENTVLSHDLLEGCYLRCGLASDILLMDGYPTKYNSFMQRLTRWIRGDWQITNWLKKKKLNLLSKYKILDNLRRSLLEISFIVAFFYTIIICLIFQKNKMGLLITLTLAITIPFILELLNKLIFKKEGEEKQQAFAPKITGIKGILLRTFITLGTIPYKVYVSAKAIIKTIYRTTISHKNLLEWITSEEAEKQSKTDLLSYYLQMSSNWILGIILICFSIGKNIQWISTLLGTALGIWWVLTPFVMWYISRENKEKEPLSKLSEKEKNYLKNIAEKTWQFFEKYITKENNYLIPDNYQEDRKEKVVPRTSSTNIGLSLMAIISAYDMNFIDKEEANEMIKNVIYVIESLPKWNGHLYNWYNIKTKEPLIPRYISTVDSGNLAGYLYVTKSFLEDQIVELEHMNSKKQTQGQNQIKNEEIEQEKITDLKTTLQILNNLIKNMDFSLLYDKEHQIFSIGFNMEDNQLTDSYYDLLASEARQASFIAIAQKQVPAKHWNRLSKTLTILGKRKGLVSWSGTAFEYLMPNINIPKYKGSLLAESCEFMEMCQLEYAKKLGLPWGISEAAFNLKDLHSNYQYKAFGIPWLGLKRGLADEMVVASYGSVLALSDHPKEVVENLKKLENYGMNGKYGFYESIDFTPERVEKGKKASVVKTYMAHHQALILLAINNFFHKQILQKRFMQNPEMEATSILLQEIMPETSIITKEKKEKVEKLKYTDYEDYSQEVYTKINEKLVRGYVISNEDYVIAMSQKGEGISKYQDIYINRFKNTDDYAQGIFFAVKNIKTKKIIQSYREGKDENQYKISFMPDRIEQEFIQDDIKTKIQIGIAPNEPTEIREMTLENRGQSEEILEITSYFEPVLSKKEQDYAHPAFNNLFLIFEYDEETQSLIVKRKKRGKDEKELFLAVTLETTGETIGDLEYEIDEEKFIGSGNLGIPKMVQNSSPLSKKIGLVTEPIVAVKRTIKIKPQQKVIANLLLAVGEDKETALENIKKYKAEENVKKAFELGRAKVEAQNRYLRIKANQMESYQKMLSYIIFSNPMKKINRQNLPKRSYLQSELWKYGISGDLPIILVKIKDRSDCDILKEVLNAYEFFRIKKVETELVILNEEKYSYENYLKEEIDNIILNEHIAYLKNIRGGIFELAKNEMDPKDVELINFVASITLDGKRGNLSNSLRETEENYFEHVKAIENEAEPTIIEDDKTEDINLFANTENLKYYNEYGAFSEDGKEYFIRQNKENRLPTVWSHIMANEKFGTLVTQNMGGYTWYKNSRLNRITSWENQPNLDNPSEVIFLKDENGKTWSLGLNPKPDNRNYQVVYGFGYAKFLHKSNGIEQIVETFVSKEDSIKIQIVNLKNITANRRKIKLIYYAKPVLGEDEIKSNGNISIKYEPNSNILWAQNLYNSGTEFAGEITYVSCSEKIKSYTGEKDFFFGKGGLSNPDGLKKPSLNNQESLGKKACMAYEIEIEIESLGQKEIVLMLGTEENLLDSKNMAYKYSKVQNAKQELEKVKNYWNELLGKLQVKTPLESMNIILNGWTNYQTISSRLQGRTGYYQSGGAFGFRDQLQDTLALKFIEPNFLKNQIIKHAKHQFIEGDVEHWWHEETKRGIRTRFSDDLLWLPYLTSEYINFTGDTQILEIQVPYLQGKPLEENEDERYDLYMPTNEQASIYEHCIKAIEKSLNFGEHGLPKIGSGDWNDGLNTVGNKGKGESIWLGFFLYNVLDRFVKIIRELEAKNSTYSMQTLSKDLEDLQDSISKMEEQAQKYETIMQQLKKALNNAGWDGRWYKRAYMDNGDALGSMENDECRIDSIAQSWSIISNAGDNDKKYISIESLENHLVDKENGIIKLLDPPFEKGKLEPGYIKAYLPGVRENGGQYTHASCWVIIAEAMLGFGDKALELYRMINPIEHARTKEASTKYKVEPYVIPADIYGAGNLAGRGGWTWYTGSSSWYYKAGIEYILGLQIEKGFLKIRPCIPKEWKEYEIHYKWKNSIYHILVKNPNGNNNEVCKVLVNGVEVDDGIKLEENGVYMVEVYLGTPLL